MASKVTIKMCMDLEFTRSPEEESMNISQIETTIDSLIENMNKAREISDYIVKGDSKFSLRTILQTFYNVNDVKTYQQNPYTWVHQVPFMTITEKEENTFDEYLDKR